MAKNPGNPEEGSEFNKIDLSAFEDFNFGTQWTEASGSPKGGDTDRRTKGGPLRKDRRPSRRFPPREPVESRSQRPPRSSEGRHDGSPPDHRRTSRRPGRQQPRRAFRDEQPYVSDIFEVRFYPEEHGFNALVKAMRASCRTYELFEIAHLILMKLERCLVVLRRIAAEDGEHPQVAISVPDGLPFETEEEAGQHVLDHHLSKYFDVEEIEVDPPKGNFQVIHRCPVTKEILGPPNYHRYSDIVEEHHAAKVSQIPLERYRSSLVSSREEVDIQTWLEKMKKTVRYIPKVDLGEDVGPFDSLGEARSFLLRTARGKIVKLADYARIGACELEEFPTMEAARAMEGALERQRRFPLETANVLRGRLRRENFHIFKRGSKGITYACSVRRKFRQPGQSLGDTVQNLISYLETNPMTPVATLAEGFFGIPSHVALETDGDQVESLSDEKKEMLKRMGMDLRWLVSEGYVAEFSDGRLFAFPSAQEPFPRKERKTTLPSERPMKAQAAGTVANSLTETSSPPEEIRNKDKAVEGLVGESETDPENSVQGSAGAVPVSTPKVVSDILVTEETTTKVADESDVSAAGADLERPENSEGELKPVDQADVIEESETRDEKTKRGKETEVEMVDRPEEPESKTQNPKAESDGPLEDEDREKPAD
jgi:hypothetical protein